MITIIPVWDMQGIAQDVYIEVTEGYVATPGIVEAQQGRRIREGFRRAE